MDVAREGEEVAVRIRRRGPLDAKQLRILLFQYAECLRDMSDPEQWSEVTALIRCDRDVPFREVQKIFDACMDPDVRIYRIAFAVRSPDREPGSGVR